MFERPESDGLRLGAESPEQGVGDGERAGRWRPCGESDGAMEIAATAAAPRPPARQLDSPRPDVSPFTIPASISGDGACPPNMEARREPQRGLPVPTAVFGALFGRIIRRSASIRERRDSRVTSVRSLIASPPGRLIKRAASCSASRFLRIASRAAEVARAWSALSRDFARARFSGSVRHDRSDSMTAFKYVLHSTNDEIGSVPASMTCDIETVLFDGKTSACDEGLGPSGPILLPRPARFGASHRKHDHPGCESLCGGCN